MKLISPDRLPGRGEAMTTVYRRMDSEDVEGVRELVCRTMDVSYRGVYSPRAIAFFKDYHSAENIERDARSGTTLVAFLDGALTGTGTLVDGEIKRVFVDPERQGRGIGRGLMERLIEQARAEGRSTATLDASLDSRGVYEHLGFRSVREGRHDLGDGLFLDYTAMALDL
jgi:GNAT superfamily N-acetyltransferase